MVDGKPDLSGVWMHFLDFKPEESPLRPEPAAIMRQRVADRNPATPRAGLLSEPIKLVQSPRVLPEEFELPA